MASQFLDELQLWAYWEAQNAGNEIDETIEFLLFTEAWVTGGQGRFGPYLGINTMTHHMQSRTRLQPAIVVRAELRDLGGSASERIVEQTKRFETDGYHGGTLLDEVAALVALCFGVRVRAGQVVRRFTVSSPLGFPEFHNGLQAPYLPVRTDGRRVIPEGREAVGIEELEELEAAIHLGTQQRRALMRAARLYQGALWIAEEDAAMAWLLLVSAVEAIASAQWPERKDAKRKFCNIIEQYLPEAPATRPLAYGQISWCWRDLQAKITRIYEHRCSALHQGIPFPLPLCEPPLPTVLEGNRLVAEEAPRGAVWIGVSGWRREDLPMHIHVFAHVVRGVLRNWLRGVADANKS